VLSEALRFVAEPGRFIIPSLVTLPPPYRTIHPSRVGRVTGRLCSSQPPGIHVRVMLLEELFYVNIFRRDTISIARKPSLECSRLEHRVTWEKAVLRIVPNGSCPWCSMMGKAHQAPSRNS